MGVTEDFFINPDFSRLILIDNINSIEHINTKLEIFYAKEGLGFLDRKMTINQLTALFNKDDFFFIPHAGNDQSIVKAYKEDIEDAQKMVILMQSAIEKVTKEEIQIAYNEGFDKKKPTTLRDRNDIAYINFSDNHNIGKYPCRHMGQNGMHEFDYIKGSKSYETIRLAFIDPASRIITSQKKKELLTQGTFIESYRIRACDFINDVELEFSPHLNVIIGGRSSGKSLLLWLINRNIDSVVHNDDYMVNNIQTLIKTQNDHDFKETTTIDHDDIITISQGEIVGYFEKKQLKELAKKAGKSVEYDNSITEFNNHARALGNLQSNLIDSYKKAYETNDKQRYILHAQTIESILSNALAFRLNASELLDENDKSKEIEEIIAIIEDLELNIEKLKSNSLIAFSQEESEVFKRLNEILELKKEEVESISVINNCKIKFINSCKKLVDDSSLTLELNARQKIEAQRNLSSLVKKTNDKFKRFANLKYDSDKIETFQYALNKEINIHENINLVLEVDNSNKLRIEILETILGYYSQLNLYLNLTKLLSGRLKVKNYKNSDPTSFMKKLEVQLKPIKDLMTSPNDYLRYGQNETSNDKSPGYNSEKYLEIILKQSKTNNIIIDQPEDNLGNKFIANDLVNLLREIKHQKQVFLVTHNPSIVVYGDAENIIYSENRNNKISYKQIKLEDKDAQEIICDVLDGGEYIFNKRSEKYDIKRILIN